MVLTGPPFYFLCCPNNKQSFVSSEYSLNTYYCDKKETAWFFCGRTIFRRFRPSNLDHLLSKRFLRKLAAQRSPGRRRSRNVVSWPNSFLSKNLQFSSSSVFTSCRFPCWSYYRYLLNTETSMLSDVMHQQLSPSITFVFNDETSILASVFDGQNIQHNI